MTTHITVRKGDLAIITKSLAGNEGRIVEVGEFLGQSPIHEGYRWCRGFGDCCMVTVPEGAAPLNSFVGKKLKQRPYVAAWLRPVSGIPNDTETDTSKDLTKDKELHHD